MNDYRCRHCGRVVKRKSTKQWVKSYCGKSGRDVHLVRQPKGAR